MGVVVRAKIQTVEDIYGLIRRAVTERQPISALYDRLPRLLLCPHRLGRNSARQARVLCYQYGGESSTELEPSGSLANWRCMKLEKFSRVEVLEGLWHTAPNHSRPQTCVTDMDVDAENYPDRKPHSGQ
jgi:hypothetical protein